MFLIRSISQAQSGRRDEAAALMKEFAAESHKELGQPEARILTGSIGPTDSTVVMESVVKSLADFEQGLEKTNKWAGMQRYGKRFAELFISGTHHFEIYRIQP
jgi:hypothetical protein